MFGHRGRPEVQRRGRRPAQAAASCASRGRL